MKASPADDLPILFVDDEPASREIFSRMGNRLGFQVHTAESGATAIEMAQEHRYSVVVTDLRMPGLDGMSLIERLRSIQAKAQYLVLTGDADSSAARLDTSILDVMPKPIDLGRLESSLRRAVSIHRRTKRERPKTIRLLLVEDELADRLLFTRSLRLEMPLAEVTTASRVEEAVAKIAESPFDAVLSDLSLPDARGLEALDRLRECAPELPIVVLTNLNNEKLALQSVKKGAQDYLVKDNVTGSSLSRALRYAIERKSQELEIRKLAFCDQTTGVLNRCPFKDRMARALRRAEQDGKQVGLLYGDLDRFKEVNDDLGHDEGDRILREIAQRIRRISGESHQVARLGGDEFGILVETGADQLVLEELAAAIVLEVAKPIQYGGGSVAVDISIGVSLYPDHGITTDGLLGAADGALQIAKQEWSAPVQFSK